MFNQLWLSQMHYKVNQTISGGYQYSNNVHLRIRIYRLTINLYYYRIWLKTCPKEREKLFGSLIIPAFPPHT